MSPPTARSVSPPPAGPGGLRRAGPADLEAATSLWLAITEHHRELDPYFLLRPSAPGEARRLLEAMLADPDVAAWVHETEGEVDALCIARVDRAPPVLEEVVRGTITDLGVRPERRRRGIGAGLVALALRWIEARGARRVEVRVARGNAEGQAFWRSQGFGDFMETLHRRL